MTARDELAATIMATLNEHGGSYRLPKDPSDLAYAVADAIVEAQVEGLDVERLWRVLEGFGVIDNGTWVSFRREDAEKIAREYEETA